VLEDVMTNREKRLMIDGAIDALSEATVNEEGMVAVSQDGILELLAFGKDAVARVEQLEEAAGTLLEDIEKEISSDE
jgi:hypothetical protein